MKKISWFLLVLVATSLSACAPAYYEATYHDHYEPTGHVSVLASNSYVVHDYRPVVDHHHYGAIEVTLFADRAFVGANFHPIHLVIHDGDFVEVPMRSKIGVLKRVYAHYHRGDLHFDSGRHCGGIHGSSRYKYDKRWDRGHRYDHISAGPDFDLRGFGLIVRKHEGKRARHTAKNTALQKNTRKPYVPVPRKAINQARESRGKIHVAGFSAGKNHLDSRPVSFKAKNEKPVKRQVVMKERLAENTVKVKSEKVDVGKNRRGIKQIVERSNVDQTNKRYQGKSRFSTNKQEVEKVVKAEKKRKNSNVVAKVKGKNKVGVEKDKKSKKGASGDNVDDLVAMSGDESAVLIGRYDKMYTKTRTKINY